MSPGKHLLGAAQNPGVHVSLTSLSPVDSGPFILTFQKLIVIFLFFVVVFLIFVFKLSTFRFCVPEKVPQTTSSDTFMETLNGTFPQHETFK